MRKIVTALGTIACLVFAAAVAGAQDYRARVQGAVVDSSGGALPGTTVTLTNEATGVAVTRVTDGDGRYLFDFVDPGMYTVVAELQGFRPAEQRNVRVQQRGNLTVDLSMSVGDVQERVVVEAAPVAVQFRSAGTEIVLEKELLYYQTMGDPQVLDPIVRGMNAFIVTQHGPPQAGWALQYTLDLKPAGARTYEPNSLVTHTTATNVELLLKFHRLTGETKFLARIGEALDWLDSVKVTPDVAPLAGGRTHPTFVELGTNKPLYGHRTGSNVVNDRYYVDYDPHKTLGHYSAFRKLDVAGLRKQFDAARAMTPEEATKDSPLRPGAGIKPILRFFIVGAESNAPSAARAIESLNAAGFWPAPLGYNSNPYKGPGSTTVAPGDFSTTHVGDDTDTSPYPDPKLIGISTEAYIRNMGALIRQLTQTN